MGPEPSLNEPSVFLFDEPLSEPRRNLTNRNCIGCAVCASDLATTSIYAV